MQELPDHANVRQVADHIGVSVKTIRNYIKDGRLEAVRLGPKMIRVKRESVETLMQPIGDND